TVVATHLSLYRSLAAAEALSAEGIECEVIDPLTLLPLDTDTLWESVRRTGRLVIVHEDTLTGGWGAEVAARAADECLFSLEAPVKRVAALDVPIPYAPVLEQAVVPSVERIAASVGEVCGCPRGRCGWRRSANRATTSASRLGLRPRGIRSRPARRSSPSRPTRPSSSWRPPPAARCCGSCTERGRPSPRARSW